MLFVQTTTEFGSRMRKQLEMSDDPPAPDSNTPYFNPAHEGLLLFFLVFMRFFNS